MRKRLFVINVGALSHFIFNMAYLATICRTCLNVALTRAPSWRARGDEPWEGRWTTVCLLRRALCVTAYLPSIWYISLSVLSYAWQGARQWHDLCWEDRQTDRQADGGQGVGRRQGGRRDGRREGRPRLVSPPTPATCHFIPPPAAPANAVTTYNLFATCSYLAATCFAVKPYYTAFLFSSS